MHILFSNLVFRSLSRKHFDTAGRPSPRAPRLLDESVGSSAGLFSFLSVSAAPHGRRDLISLSRWPPASAVCYHCIPSEPQNGARGAWGSGLKARTLHPDTCSHIPQRSTEPGAVLGAGCAHSVVPGPGRPRLDGGREAGGAERWGSDEDQSCPQCVRLPGTTP